MMNKLIKVSEFAKNDITESFNWYEEQKEDLGTEFINDLSATISSIKSNPLQYQKIYKTTRRALLYTFKFGVFYSIHKNEILIRRVLHTSRNPNEWKK